jgi:hypothetical protein
MISRARINGFLAHRERRAETWQVAVLILIERYEQWKQRISEVVWHWVFRLLTVLVALQALMS